MVAVHNIVTDPVYASFMNKMLYVFYRKYWIGGPLRNLRPNRNKKREKKKSNGNTRGARSLFLFLEWEAVQRGSETGKQQKNIREDIIS